MNGEAGPKAGLDTLQDDDTPPAVRRRLEQLDRRIAHAVQAAAAANARIRELEAKRTALAAYMSPGE
jgi:hypothetical protein